MTGTYPKYVFKDISEFAIDGPAIITGDNYNQHDPVSGTLFGGIRINIFNISKINAEVRGGKAPRIKRLSEFWDKAWQRKALQDKTIIVKWLDTQLDLDCLS